MFDNIKEVIHTYKNIRFWLIVGVVAVCLLLVGLQVGIMYAFQSQNPVWEGVCNGGDLIEGNDSILMTVHCPTQDEFKISNFLVILASKNEDKTFYCKKTEGNILKDETWKCNVLEESE